MFCSKANLEVEIIIYRQLLDASGIQATTKVASRYQSVTNETTGKFVLKRQKRGSIIISKYDKKKKETDIVNRYVIM